MTESQLHQQLMKFKHSKISLNTLANKSIYISIMNKMHFNQKNKIEMLRRLYQR